jgi:hypothetical protein
MRKAIAMGRTSAEASRRSSRKLNTMPTVESPADFDRYVAERNIPEEEWPELSLAGSPSARAG